MPNYLYFSESSPREVEVLELSVLFDNHFFKGTPTQIHFTSNSDLVGAWVDEQGAAHLSVGLDRVKSLNSEQLTFLIAHEYGHLVLKHPTRTSEIQKQYGVKSSYDEFLLSFDAKRDYSKLMRDMELQADLFATKVVKGLGQDPVAGASFLVGETKSIQHPEGTLRLAKIKSEQGNLVAENFDTTIDGLTWQSRDTEFAALTAVGNSGFPANEFTVKAAAEHWPETGATNPSVTLYGVEAAALLTVAILACALPSWWRKASMG